MGLFQGTQERVRNSCGKQVISVRATEGRLCMYVFPLKGRNSTNEMLTYSCIQSTRHNQPR